MNMRSWWENLLDRERQMLTVGGILGGILFVYAAIWTPLSDAVEDRKMAVVTQHQLLHDLKNTSAKIQQLKAEGVHADISDNIDLLSMAEQTLSQEALSTYLKQVKQPDKNQVALTFENIPFDKLMQWLQTLTTSYGVHVLQLNATRLPVIGVANVTIVISTTQK
ncbi:MAG: hypothetical protein A3F13_00205 [Gammaproteobacteria bacterium RIFCSPHIGHO2_12_FULL_40_19]|nr:MAG: hypothetical protein A3F13_00205 [Gammaproteobacteria bacterium RIFCSPHIGHO2_12_FULL_40_19]